MQIREIYRGNDKNRNREALWHTIGYFMVCLFFLMDASAIWQGIEKLYHLH